MQEVEAKFRVRSLDSLRSRIDRLGGEFLSSGMEIDTYFHPPDRDFRVTDEALRLRRSDRGYELTYKGPRKPAGGVKAREEITLSLGDAGSCIAILTRTGFVPAAEVRKVRDTYRIGEATVTLDQVEGLGEYVEIEVISDDTETASKIIERLRMELGIGGESIHESYLELIQRRHSGARS
ncbi:MAG: class IV adenylate cyclase [Methanoculleaceae archaeon]